MRRSTAWKILLSTFSSLRADAEETQDVEAEGGAEDDLQVSKFYTNPITKPIPHTQPSPSLQDTINELNVRRAVGAHNGLDLSSEEISLGDESVQEERDDELEAQKPPHPAGTWWP